MFLNGMTNHRKEGKVTDREQKNEVERIDIEANLL